MTGGTRRSGATPRGGGRLRQATSGDRPYVLALFGLLVLLAAMLIGPLQTLTAAADRVDQLEARREELRGYVDELEQRRERLRDPDEVELMAREQLGLVKPGEIPYVVTDPERDVEQLRPDGRAAEPRERPPWWRRLQRAFGALFR